MQRIYTFLLVLLCQVAWSQNTASLVKDIAVGPASSAPSSFVQLNGTTYFVASEGGGNHLFRTDGTEAGTVRLSTTSGLSNVVAFNGNLYYLRGIAVPNTSSIQIALFRSNGTAGNEIPLDTLNSSISGMNGSNLEVDGSQLRLNISYTSPRDRITSVYVTNGQVDNARKLGDSFFQSRDVTSQSQFFRSNTTDFFKSESRLVTGTSSETIYRVTPTAVDQSIWTNGGANQIKPHGVINGQLIFSAYPNGTTGATGTPRNLYGMDINGNVVTLRTGTDSIVNAIVNGNQLYFATIANQIFRTDGRVAGTVQITQSNSTATPNLPQSMGRPIVINNQVYFFDALQSFRFWKISNNSPLFEVVGVLQGGFNVDPVIANVNGTPYIFAGVPSSRTSPSNIFDISGGLVSTIEGFDRTNFALIGTDLVVNASESVFQNASPRGNELWKVGLNRFYCASRGTAPWEQWISNVQIQSTNGGAATVFQNASQKEGYGDFTNQVVPLIQGNTFLFILTPSFSWEGDPRNRNFGWQAWIDWNQNGTFEAGELVFSQPLALMTTGNSTNSVLLAVPASASVGRTRMRVAIRENGASPPDPCATFQRGEVEDYTVNITGGVAAQPNLTMTYSNGGYTIDRSLTFFEARVINSGTATSAATRAKVYISRDSANNGTGQLLHDFAVGSLSAGVNQQYGGSAGIPDTFVVGRRYYFVAVVDPDNAVSESNESDNVVITGFTPSPSVGALPDLILSNLTLTTTPPVSAGSAVNYRFNISNIGTATAQNFSVKTYISRDNVLSADDIQDGGISTGNFAPGQTLNNATAATNIPSNLAAGNYYLILKVDADNQIVESNENNNLFVLATPFAVTNVAPPTTCTNNLLQNAGFESGLTNWEGNGVSTTTANTGTRAARICNSGDVIYQQLTAVGGRVYQLNQMSVRVDANTNGLVGIKFMNSSFTPILDVAAIGINQNQSAYTQLFNTAYSITAPAGAAYVQVYVTKSNGSGCIYLDDVCFTSGNTGGGSCPKKYAARVLTSRQGTVIGPLVSTVCDSFFVQSGTNPTFDIYARGTNPTAGFDVAGENSNFGGTSRYALYLRNGSTTPPAGFPANLGCTGGTGTRYYFTGITGSVFSGGRGAIAAPAQITAGNAVVIVNPNANLGSIAVYADVLNGFAISGGTPADNCNFCTNDQTPPTFNNCPRDTTVLVTAAAPRYSFVGSISTATDNCFPYVAVWGGLNVDSYTINAGNSLAVSVTARDANGNTANCNYTIRVQLENTGGGADLGLSIVPNPTTYRPYATNVITVTARNTSATPMTNVRIEVPFPANTVNGGNAVASLGTWNEWCAGGRQCFEWTIPTLAANSSATLAVPLYVLNPSGNITVTTRLLASTPTDVNAANNVATVTLNRSTATSALVTNRVVLAANVLDQDKAQLSWVSIEPTRTTHYEIQTLNENGVFETQNAVAAKYLDDSMHDYSYMETQSLPDNVEKKVITYRIKAIILGGGEILSTPKTLTFTALSNAEVFPNPASDNVFVALKKYENQSVVLSVYDNLGRLITKNAIESASSAPVLLDTKDWLDGTYLLKIEAKNYKTILRRFVVTH
ncbi:MAG: hypothetical protein RL757_3010 [Bacteroidota bacterium]|jgi:hypothetical protein